MGCVSVTTTGRTIWPTIFNRRSRRLDLVLNDVRQRRLDDLARNRTNASDLFERRRRLMDEWAVYLVARAPRDGLCDAEQIIHAQIDRSDGNRVIYTMGGIEASERYPASHSETRIAGSL